MARAASIRNIALIIFALMFCSHACPPPLNDVRSFHDATLLTNDYNKSLLNPELGAAHALGSGGHLERWPTGADGVVRITFCFADEYSKKHLSYILSSAWEVWHKVLGDPGPRSGHRLGGFVQFQTNGQTPYCYTNWKKKLWNTKVPKDVVAIDAHVSSTPLSLASLGYRPAKIDDFGGRHEILIGYFYGMPQDEAIYTVAHEMGHLFGLVHEHQRPDRDHYVKFECKNLVGYDQMKAYINQHKPPDVDMDKMCTSAFLSNVKPYNQFGFGASAYSTQPDPDFRTKDALYIKTTADSYYDVDSIMHYFSTDYMDHTRPVSLDTVVMTFWKHGAPNYVPPAQATEENSEIRTAEFFRTPSQGDKAVIKRLYPWGKKS